MSNTNSTDDFLKGNFELNCPKIEIIPVLTGTNRKSLTGSGVISINDNGYFNIKVFFPETFSLSETFESQKWEAGKIIDDEYFYNIVAYDINGQVWYAERFIPDRSSGPNGSIIIGKVPELHRVQEYPASTEKNYLQLFFNETIDIPLNTAVKEQIQIGDKTRDVKQSLRIARFKCLDIDFEIDTANGNTVISAVSDKIDFTDVVINRIYESFRFVTAHPKSWSMLSIISDGKKEIRIKAIKKSVVKTRIQAPINYQNKFQNENVWRLYELYLSFIIKNTENTQHPVSDLFHSILESGKASLDVEALTLSVSIESLLKDELNDIYSLSGTLIKDLKKEVKRIEKSKTLSDEYKARIKGALSSMGSARAKDILFVLRDQSVIDKGLVSTYSKLRNKTAHGTRVSGADIQNYFNQTSAVLVLFYHLTFLLIGYKGEYTDYGSYDYPTKEFSSDLP